MPLHRQKRIYCSKKLVCTKIPYNLLGLLLYEQLDTEYGNLEFVNEPVTSVAAMIAEAAENIRPKILILLRNGNCIHTMFKNRFLCSARASDSFRYRGSVFRAIANSSLLCVIPVICRKNPD